MSKVLWFIDIYTCVNLADSPKVSASNLSTRSYFYGLGVS